MTASCWLTMRMKLVLIIRQLQQQVVATRALVDATLLVAGSTRRYVWPRVAGTGDVEEPSWENMPAPDVN